MEISITLGILLLLVAMAAPFLLTYKGKSQVNRAQELTKATLERAEEDAKTAGFPIPESMKQSGLPDLAASQAAEGTTLLLRERRRVSKGGAAEIVSEKHLSGSDAVRIGFSGVGNLDLSSDTDTLGVFVEFAETDGTSVKTLAVIPVDVNGELVLQGSLANATIWYSYGDYRRELQLRVQGTVTVDRR